LGADAQAFHENGKAIIDQINEPGSSPRRAVHAQQFWNDRYGK
jgi:hypothetical protein